MPQYFHPQVPEMWHGQQVASHPGMPSLPPDYVHMVPEAYYQELQRQQKEVAELHGQLVKEQNTEVWCQRESLDSTTAECEHPELWEEQQGTYSDAFGPYFGEEDILKAHAEPLGKRKRIAAACCIVVLAVLAVGVVVLFVETAK